MAEQECPQPVESIDFRPSRRQFAGLVGSSSLLALAGCGGGGGGDSDPGAPPPPPPPPPPDPLAITQQPTAVSTVAGLTARFSVKATGQNLTYQWRRNGADVAGATADSYEFIAQRSDDGARFSVRVSGSGTSTLSADATLNVAAAPEASGLSLLAGGLGGQGFLEGKGAAARTTQPKLVAAAKDGGYYFYTGAIQAPLYQIWRVSADGDARYVASLPSVILMDATGMACSPAGELFICAGTVNAIYKLVEQGTPSVTLVAGLAEPALPSGGGFVDGAGTSARLKQPTAPVFDQAGNMYFIDAGNRAIRKLDASGVVSTVAGQPANATMADGQGAAAGFTNPTAITLLSDGNLLITDASRFRLATPTGAVTTLPLSLTNPPLSAAALEANIWTFSGSAVRKLALDGSSNVLAGSTNGTLGYADGIGEAARFGGGGPASPVVSSAGQIVVADIMNNVIRRIDVASRQTSTVLGKFPQPGQQDGAGDQARFDALGTSCVDSLGNVYATDKTQKKVRKITPDGQVTTLFSDFPVDGGIAVDAAGSFYGVRNRTIVKVSPDGGQQVVAGQAGVLGFSDGQGTQATFAQPGALAFDAQGNLLIGDMPLDELIVSNGGLTQVTRSTYGGTVRKLTPTGLVSTLAGTPGRTLTSLQSTSASEPPPEIRGPASIASDTAGNIYVMDSTSRSLRKIAPNGAVSILVDRSNGSNNGINGTAKLLIQKDGALYFVDGSQDTIVRKLDLASGAVTVTAGRTERTGVQPGPLPGTLAPITGLVSGPDKRIHVFSENSWIKIVLS
jgi:sugar lactone lactonase YvrE